MLTLTDDERDTLERWARRATTAQALAQRARVVLACASGRTNTESRANCGPRRISDAHVEQMVTRTLEAKPREATHWSTRAMAARCGLSQSTVSRIWRAFGL
jgi:hypothetical protein